MQGLRRGKMEFNSLGVLIHGVQMPFSVAGKAMEGTVMVGALIGIALVGEPRPAERNTAPDSTWQRLWRRRQP